MSRQTSYSGRSTSSSSHHSMSGGSAHPPPPPPPSTPNAAAASHPVAASLSLLLREDPLLIQWGMHTGRSTSSKEQEQEPQSRTPQDTTDQGNKETTTPAYGYAAALLESTSSAADANSSTTIHSKSQEQLAKEALEEVDRKLTLVESLAERVSRNSPEAVAGSLLALHGYSLEEEEKRQDELEGGLDSNNNNNSSNNTSTTLLATRERCQRLQRQGEVLEGVAIRVEKSLQRGYHKMSQATQRLGRVLQLSSTLKMVLRLQFEASKCQGYDLEDWRDLTRAAASVAVMEDLLAQPELAHSIDVVEAIRPQALATGTAVRQAAADLLAQQHPSHRRNSSQATFSSSSTPILQLGATLQVYFHLGELPQAVWNAVQQALTVAEKVGQEFWSPTTLANLTETATTEAKLTVGKSSSSNYSNQLQRTIQSKLKEFRAQAAQKWAHGITEAALQVWNLQQVLCRKSDPVTRQLFVDVVAEAPIPEPYDMYSVPSADKSTTSFDLFALFWERLCHKMGDRLKHILEYEHGKFVSDVSALYPAVRAASIGMLTRLTDTMQMGVSTTASHPTLEDTTTTSLAGVLGGSAALNDPFLQWTTPSNSTILSANGKSNESTVVPTATSMITSADTWTRTRLGNVEEEEETPEGEDDREGAISSYKSSTTANSAVSMSAVFNSPYWISLQGNHASSKGLFRLQRAFLEASRQRLWTPLQFMFQENVELDEAGNALSYLPLLPSRHDIQQLDVIMRQELALADPREGSGDLSAVTMISENVTDMISQFCEQGQNALSNAGEDGLLDPKTGAATEALLHDLKMAKIMNAMSQSLKSAPEKVFLDPYRPSITARLEESATLCEQALKAGLKELDRFVQTYILGPLCRAINQRLGSEIGRIHYSSYLQTSSDADEDEGPSFVQKSLNDLYEYIATEHLSRLPKKYATMVAASIATYSIYTFVSHASLMRPLAETTRLHLTQDLADLELVLEQLLSKGGQGKHLADIGNGKPYHELRAVRQMLFWTGLDDNSKPAQTIVKTMLRESWVQQVRPSTVFHYLFAFAPSLLSSPHHFKRVKVDEYVAKLVSLDGSVEEGEAGSWMTTLACCDSYQQRESAASSRGAAMDGDARVPTILMHMGPELLRRHRH